MPGMAGKLDDAWDEPYEVNRRCNDVNYEICDTNQRSKLKGVHINHLKLWADNQAQVLRIVVAAEDDSDSHMKLKLNGVKVTDDMKRTLDDIKAKYQDLMSMEVGTTTTAMHDMLTGENLPTSLCPEWRKAVKDQIDEPLP